MQGNRNFGTVATLQNIQSLLLFPSGFYFFSGKKTNFSLVRYMSHFENVCHGISVDLCARKQSWKKRECVSQK